MLERVGHFIHERIRRRGESDGFAAAWPRIDSVQGWLSRGEAELLFETALGRHGATIVEIGSYLGRSTSALALAAIQNGGRVAAIDPHTGDRSEVEFEGRNDVTTEAGFRANMTRLGLDGTVIPMVSMSTDAARDWTHGATVDVLFVDGWHSTEAVKADIDAWLPHLAEDAIVLFDDWAYPDVAAGIASRTHLLPPRQGYVGKIALYASHAVDGVRLR